MAEIEPIELGVNEDTSRRIKPKSTWDLLKPHVFQLVQSFAFPLICLSEEEVEQFSEDPQEFARTHFGGE